MSRKGKIQEKGKTDHLPERTFLEFIRMSFRSLSASPALNVASFVLVLAVVFGGLRAFSSGQRAGQVKFFESVNSEKNQSSGSDSRVLPSQQIFRGEVYETSIRLRETGALGMAISLAIFGAKAEQGSVPRDLGRIWKFLSDRRLFPPGLELKDGELTSASSRMTVRYQASPLRFEIVAVPKQNDKSPAILMRFPVISLDGRTITFFQSSSVDHFELPPPFAAFEKVVSAGWTIEQWRGELLPKTDNVQEILADEKRLLDNIGKQK